MFEVLFYIHIVICVCLVALVLLQQGRGADIGVVGGNSNTLFGAAGANTFFTKLTTGLAIAFMASSVMLVREYGSYAHGELGGLTAPAASGIPAQDVPLGAPDDGVLPEAGEAAVDVTAPQANVNEEAAAPKAGENSEAPASNP